MAPWAGFAIGSTASISCGPLAAYTPAGLPDLRACGTHLPLEGAKGRAGSANDHALLSQRTLDERARW